MTRQEAIKHLEEWKECISSAYRRQVIDMAIEALSAEDVQQSEQYKKGFEDAKRTFLVEYARESRNMRKRNAQLEVMLNIQKAISSADRPTGEWIDRCREHEDYECSECGGVTEKFGGQYLYDYCPFCGAKMRGEEE